MPISNSQPMSSREDILKSLEQTAVVLWGQERLDELRPTIEQTVEHVWRLSQDLPEFEEEPGFYF